MPLSDKNVYLFNSLKISFLNLYNEFSGATHGPRLI